MKQKNRLMILNKTKNKLAENKMNKLKKQKDI